VLVNGVPKMKEFRADLVKAGNLTVPFRKGAPVLFRFIREV
jgi:hypothetical protein